MIVMPRRAADLKKMSLNVPRETYEQLKRFAAEHGLTMTEVVRSGIETERYLIEHPLAREWLRRVSLAAPSREREAFDAPHRGPFAFAHR
jgi:predicted DNA-binding protein